MTTPKYIFLATVSALTILTACNDSFDSRGVNDSYGDRNVALEFSAGDFTPSLRGALDESAEKEIDNLYVWIYNNADGDRALPVFTKLYGSDDLIVANDKRKTKYGESDEETPSAQGLLEEGIKLPVGQYTVYMVANVPGGNYYSFNGMENPFIDMQVGEGIAGGYLKSDFEAVFGTLEEDGVSRNNGLLLMSAKETVSVTPSTKRIDVRLKRVEARIDFSIGLSEEAKGRGDTFIAYGYTIHNVPRSVYVFERPVDSSRSGKWDAPGYDSPEGSFDVNFFALDSLDTRSNRYVASFYMPESRQPYREDINAKLPQATPTERYRARAKQTKTELPDNNGSNPYLSNGEFVYAPRYAPYIEITGEYRQQLESGLIRTSAVTYRVLLGDAGNDVNDYSTCRDYLYTYRITINGVDDIIAEVNSNKETGENEPAPDNDGLVVDNNNVFQLDSHYEQRTFLIERSALELGADDNLLGLGYYISTPFQSPKLVTYTTSELQDLATSGTPAGKVTDNGWLRFYIHPSSDNTNPYSGVYYTNMTETDLLTVEQLLYRLSLPASHVDSPWASSRVKITVFVDENYYERDPSVPNSLPDKDLWKKFVNTPDRKFALLVPEKNKNPFSPDGQSQYLRSLLTLSQYSIKTVFINDAEGRVRIWGVESVDETQNLTFMGFKLMSSAVIKDNMYMSNGFANTWNLLYNGGGINDSNELSDYYSTISKRSSSMWTRQTTVHKGYVYLTSDDEANTVLDEGYQYAMFSPMTRNRDNNRDNKVQRSEMKWYLPSPAEAILFYATQFYFPEYYRYDRSAGEEKTPIILTNRKWQGFDNLVDYPSDPFIIHAKTGSSNYLIEYNSQYYGSSTKDKSEYTTCRLIRDLGVLDDGTDMGHYTDDDLKKELVRTANVAPTINDYRIIRVDHIDPKFLRKERATGELPWHDQRSSVNSIYYKGFEVATHMARPYGADYHDGKRNDKGKFANYDPQNDHDKNLSNWLNLQYDITFGKSPCATYWEYSDDPKSPNYDVGTWRVPNQAEMQMMAVNLYDWDEKEARETYGKEFFNHYGDVFGNTGYYSLGTRTACSFKEGLSWYPNTYGYALRSHGYVRLVGTSYDIEDWIHLDNDMYVRCVRDLPE